MGLVAVRVGVARSEPRDQLPQKATCTNKMQPASVQLLNAQGKLNRLLGKFGDKVPEMRALESTPVRSGTA